MVKTAKKPKPKEPELAENGRPIIYPEIVVKKFTGRDSLTADRAKLLLGWRKAVDGEEVLLTDLNGDKIVCDFNIKNRPFSRGDSLTIMQEILNERWVLNGENMVIGETGLLLSCQHRLIALVLAEQAYTLDPETYHWLTEAPTIECLIAFGVDESDRVVNTLDTGRPRTLSHVLYRSEFFQGTTAVQRRAMAKTADYAIRVLWSRTGVQLIEGKEYKKTHSESLDFIERHPSLVEWVRWVHDNDEDGVLAARVKSLGLVVALSYLMAASKSNRAAYVEYPSDETADLSETEKVKDFWEKIVERASRLSPLNDRLAMINAARGSADERIAAIARAWNVFAVGDKITAETVSLKYTEDDDGCPQLAEWPTFGGIDLGPPEVIGDDETWTGESSGSLNGLQTTELEVKN